MNLFHLQPGDEAASNAGLIGDDDESKAFLSEPAEAFHGLRDQFQICN